MPPSFVLTILVAFAAAAAGAVAVANWTLDPFGRFGQRGSGFYFNSERDIKQGLVRQRRAPGLLMGSSKVAEWPPSLIESRHVLNAAWAAALPEEMYYFLRDLKPDVEFIAIGFDFFMFNEREFPIVDRSPFGWFQPVIWSTHLFSREMLHRGIEARRLERAGARPRTLADGSRNTAGDEEADHARPRANDEMLAALRARTFREYRFASARIEALRNIRSWGIANCVVIVPFLNPMSVAVLELIADMRLQGELARFRQAARAAFPDIIDLTDGAWSDEQFYWRRDPDHYYPTVGARIFRERIEPVLAAGARPGRCSTFSPSTPRRSTPGSASHPTPPG